MALIIEGSSKCVLCDQLLDDKRAFTGFTAFISNKKGSLYIFNDAGVHVNCLDNYPLAQKAKFYGWMAVYKFCYVDKKLITNFNAFFCLGLLTSDENESLF